MTVIKPEEVKNIEQPNVQVLLNQFKFRNEMNVIDIAEIISKLITTLSVDHNSGRPKIYAISGGHLGELLGIGKGVVSQYMSVWNMPPETKQFLKNYNLSLINAYQVSRIKGKDESEIIKLQKEMIVQKNTPSSGTFGKRLDILSHTINEAEMIITGIISSYKVPQEILKVNNVEDINEKAQICKYNIEQCINYLYPEISKLSYYRKEVEFCNLMIENSEFKFCGIEINKECLNKQIMFITNEITKIEAEQKLPHISSLLMMKTNLEKNI